MDWLIDSNSPSYAEHDAVFVYFNLPHPALGNHKSSNDADVGSSNFSKLYVFSGICYALSPSKLLHDQQKDSFLEMTLLATKFWICKPKLLT